HDRPISLLVLDIDRFNRVNERHGLATGDEVVRRMAEMLEEHTRLRATVARSGGGEFAVVLPETDPHAAFVFAEELLESVRQTFSKPYPQGTAAAGGGGCSDTS